MSVELLHDHGLLIGDTHLVAAGRAAIDVREQNGGLVLASGSSRQLAPTSVALTPSQAEHLAQVLLKHASAARFRKLEREITNLLTPLREGAADA